MAIDFLERLEAMGYNSEEIDNITENLKHLYKYVSKAVLTIIRAFECLKDSMESLADFLTEHTGRNPIPRTPYKPKTKFYIPDKRLKTIAVVIAADISNKGEKK